MKPPDRERDNRPDGAPEGGAAHAKGREHAGLLRAVAENSLEIVKVVDADGTLRYASPAFEKVLGHDPDEAVGKMNVLEYVHPDDLPRVLEETEKALGEGRAVSNRAEYRFRHADGSWRWVESVGTYLLDDPAVGGVVVTVRDITWRKEAEQKLHLQAQLLGAVGEAVIALDADRKVVYWNRAAEEMYGWSAEEVVGRRLMDRVVPEDLRTHAEEVMAGVRAGLSWKGEFVVRRRDGTPLTVEATNTPVLGEDGEQVGVVGVLRDVTERNGAEEAIRRSEEERFSVLESITDAFFALDREWRFVYINARAQDLFFDAREDLLGERIWEDPTFYPEYRRAVEEGRTVEFEALYPPSGLWYSVRVYPSGLGLSVYLQDITERKRAEERLREAEERYRTLVERVPAVTYVHHQMPGGLSGATYISPQVEAVLGYTQEEYTADPEFWKSIVHPEDRVRVLTDDERTGETGEPFALDFRMLAKDGRAVWLRESGTLVRTESDGTQIWHGVMFDITELKRVERGLREAEERYRTLVEQIPAVTYIDRADGSFEALYTSPQIEDLLGYTPEEWIGGKLWEERLHPDDRERILAADERLEVDGKPFAEEYRLLARDGSVVWVREEAVLVRDGEGEPLFWQGVIFDLTERRSTEEALRESEERFRGTFEDAPIGVALVGLPSPSPEADRRYLRVNPALCEMLGYSEEELLSMTTSDVTHPEDIERSRARIGQLFEEGDSKYTLEKRYVRKDGRVVWALLNVSLVRDADGDPSHFVSQFQDVTERRALEDRLRHQALHDPLTGLPNRSLLVDRLGHALARTERRRGGQAAVLFMDLDDFKNVNDSIGHDAGDLLLMAVAERLKGCLRLEDTLARFGGDEFVVLLEDVRDPAEAVRVAERIADGFRSPFQLEGRELYARTSIGIAPGDARTKTPENLLRDADTAMYRAKEAGGGGYEVFEPAMHERALGRLELENDLRRALEEDEFVVHYQPMVRLAGGAVCAVEALVRWDHPERGLLNPGEFVSAAEESGLVVPMGERVLEEACRRAKGWQEAHPQMPPLVVSVNLSARQLSRPNLAGTVFRVLDETGLDARCLALDVTETAYVRALEGNTRVLARLREMGVGVSIDDFGIGYSSLAYLKRLPADAVKIDRSFVAGLGEDIEDTAIVRTVIELAHTFGMEAVAEGVETEGQAELLREMGCDMAQGYHFARPMPPEWIPATLSAGPQSG